MSDISGTGTIIHIRASVTYPQGITIVQAADDADPLDSASVDIATATLGVNGHLISWGTPVVIPFALNVIPNSINDVQLAQLLENNRVGRGKLRTRDIISATVIFPNGTTTKLNGGVIIGGMLMNSVASSGRLKTKPYTFSFENKSDVNVPGF